MPPNTIFVNRVWQSSLGYKENLYDAAGGSLSSFSQGIPVKSHLEPEMTIALYDLPLSFCTQIDTIPS